MYRPNSDTAMKLHKNTHTHTHMGTGHSTSSVYIVRLHWIADIDNIIWMMDFCSGWSPVKVLLLSIH